MKDIIKRLTAILLLIGLAVSFAVPATFAENGEGAVLENVTYDFKLYYNEALKEASNTTVPYDATTGKYTNFGGGTKYNGDSRIYSWLFQNYGTAINWGAEAVNGGVTGIYTNSVKAFEFRGAADQGMRVNLTKAAGKWAAIRIQVPAAGTYGVEVEGSNGSVPLSNLDMYIFPATTEYSQNTVMHDPYTATETVAAENQISTYLTNEYKVGAVTTTAQNLTCTVGEKTFNNAGDYIVVFRTTGTGSADNYIYLSSLTLIPSPEGSTETTTQATTETTTGANTETTTESTQPSDSYTDGVYDIEIYNRERYKAIFGTAATLSYAKGAAGSNEGIYNAGESIRTILIREYPAALNWSLEAFDSSMSLNNFTFYAQANTGLRIQKLNATEAASGWAAFRILVSGSGKYDLSLTTKSSWPAHDIYLFPANAQTMSEEEIEAKLSADNLVANAPKGGAQTATYKNVELASAGDYIIVLKMEETAEKTTIYLSQISLTPASGEETEPSTGPEVPTVPDVEIFDGPYIDGVYDIEIYNWKRYKAIFGTAATVSFAKTAAGGNADIYNAGESIRTILNREFPAALNWRLEAFDSSMNLGNFTFYAQANTGLRIQKLNAAEAASGWAAFRILVSGSGKYDLSLTTDGSWGAHDVYIFPANAQTMSEAEIEEKLTAETLVASMGAASARTVTYEDVEIAAAGEHIIVFKMPETANKTTIYLSKIALTPAVVEAPKEPVDEMLYDFDLVAMDEEFLKKVFPKKMDNGELAYDRIEKMYNADKIQWKYETYSSTFPIVSANFRENYLRVKHGVNFRDIENAWIAFRLESPGAGTYDVRLVSDDASKSVANIYLIPLANKNAMKPEQIQAAMTSENLLVQKAIFDDDGTFYLGEYTFGTENEYMMVVEFTKGTTLCLSQIHMTKDGLKGDGTVKKEKTYNGAVYNLNLTDPLDGIYPESAVDVAAKLSDMKSLYASGELNWNFLMASGDLMAGNDKPTSSVKFTRGFGLRVYGVKDSWIAMKIKSPGSGDFTVSIDYAEGGRNGTMAMYVLPADTDPDKLWEATDPSNRVGKVCLTNDNGQVGYEAGKTAYVGYCNFEAGKEYILLLECYDNSEFIEINGYMHINKVIMERGIIDYKATEDKKKVDYINVAENINRIADARSNAVVAEINGHDYYFLPLEGKLMVVYDLDTGELVDEVKTKDVHPRAAAIGPDGTVWLGGSMKYLAWYNPISQEYKTSAYFTTVEGMEELTGIAGLTVADDGMVYFTAYYGAYVVSYNPETNEFHNYGQLINRENMFINAITYYNGYLYVNYYSSPVDWSIIAKIDPKTGKVVATADISEYWDEDSSIMRLDMLGDDYLVAGGGGMPEAILLDPDSLEFQENDLLASISRGVSEEIDGKQYLVLNGMGLFEYDIATKEFSKVPGFGDSGFGFLTNTSYSKTLVTIDGERCLFTFTNTGGHPRLFNLDTQEYIEWNNLVVNVGGSSEIYGFTNGPEGSNEIYMGAYNTPYCAIFNTEEGRVTQKYLTAGQTDSQIFYDGKLYAGNYSSTTLNEIELVPADEATDPPTNEFIQRWKLDHALTGQMRIHTLTAGDGYVFAGTIPDTKLLGGSITVYDTRTGQWRTKRNVVQDQSIICLQYHDKLLYGTTSIHGGTDAVPAEDASAVVFVYDYETEETIAVMDPRDYISGLPKIVDYVFGITPDPKVEENGRFWMIIGEALFCFTFDRETKTFDVQEVIVFQKSVITASGVLGAKPIPVVFNEESNCLYVSFQQVGGFQQIELEDWDAEIGNIKVKSNTRLMGKTPIYYVMGEDGNIYFGNAGSLAMLPLNVTDEDWAIAGAVDQMILDIGEEITLESETAIKEAYSAYNNLSWYYKALIQNLELLKEKESDLLECKIDTVPGIEVSADNYPVFQAMMDEYDALNDRQQRYVKNYDVLKAAYNGASDLNDQRIAGALQKRIDALKDKFPLTLDNEPEVLQIRADYNVLTGKQSLLVDTTILKDAESQIAVLRAEFVQYVESLIQAIPDEITLEAEPVIMTAKEGVDKLYNIELKQISYAKFDRAFSMLNMLKMAKADAEEVDLLIQQIGIVTLGDKDRIAAAREAYDTLSDTALQFLTKGKKLQRAEFILKSLQSWGIPAITVVNAALIFALIPSLRKKIFKGKKKTEEVIDN